MLKRLNKNDNKIKIQFNVLVHTIKDIPSSCAGNDIWIECKRGSKGDNLKSTKKITLKEKETTAVFEEKVSFVCSFVQNAKTKKFEPKKEAAFTLNEDNKSSKKKNAVAKGKIDLATFAEPGTIRHETITLATKEKKKGPTLTVKIESMPLKINNKNVVKATNDSDAKNTDKVEIGGENYVLQTADEITETGASMSDGEEDSDFPDEDDDAKSSTSLNKKDKKEKKEKKEKKDKKERRTGGTMTTAESSRYLAKTTDSPKSVPATTTATATATTTATNSSSNGFPSELKEQMEVEIADLKKDKERLERRLQKAEAAAKAEPVATGSGSAETLVELEDLKKDKSRLEKRVEKLNKELSDIKASSPAPVVAVTSSNHSSSVDTAKWEEEKKKYEERLSELSGLYKKEQIDRSKMRDDLDKVIKKETEAKKKAEDSEKKKVTELESAKKELQQKTQQVTTLELELKSMKESKGSSSSVSENDGLDVLESKIVQLESRIQLEEDQRKQLLVEMDTHKSSSKKHKEKKKALAAELEKLRKENEINSKSLLEKENSVKILEDQVKQLKSEDEKKSKRVSALEKDLQSSKDKDNEKRLAKMSEGEATKELQNELSNLKKQLNEANNQIASLESKLKEKENALAQLTGKYDIVERERDDATSSLEEISEKYQENKKEIKKLREKLKESEEEADELREQLEKAKKSSTTTVVPVAAVTASPSSSGETRELEKQKKQLEKELKELKAELESDKKKNSQNIKKLQDTIEANEKEIDDLKSRSNGNSTEKSMISGSDDEQLKMKIQAKRQEKEMESLKKKVAALQRETQEKGLIEAGIYASDIEYDEDNGTPGGVKLIVNSIVSWSSFDPVNEDLLNGIVSAIKKSFARSAYDSESLAYWLSFTTHLFESLKEEVPSDADLDLRSLEDINLKDDLEDFNPITKFFHELISVSYDIYCVLLINVYSQLDNILTPAVLDHGSMSDATSKNKKSAGSDFPTILGDIIKLLKKNYISEPVIKSFIRQIFYFVDAQLFNTLLQRPALFTCSSGFQIKMAISQVEASVTKADKSLATIANKQLNHIKESVNFLVMDKSIVNDAQMVEQIFSHLNVIQLKKILDSFKPDDLSPEPVPDVVRKAISDACRRNPDLPVELDPMNIKRVNLLAPKL